MYVCMCYGVSDWQIRKAAQSGCSSMRELGQALNVGRQCGRCAPMARELLREGQGDTRAHVYMANLLAHPA